MAVLQSSQNFVRALKAPTDPPVAGGPLKISLAEQAWKETTFYIPSKAEVIADWLLSKLFKEKGNVVTNNPIADKRYWVLVLDVISSNHGSESSNSRQTNVWLRSLLSRISVAPILLAFLDILHDLPSDGRDELALQIGSCMSILWPLGTQKISTEGLLECFGALLTKMNGYESSLGIIKIGMLVTDSYRNSLSNSSGRRKLQNVFLQNQAYFCSWLEHVSYEHEAIPLYETLKESIFKAGIETVFNIDTLRQVQESKDELRLFYALRRVMQGQRLLVFAILPRLFLQHVQALRRHRGALFSQGSHQVPGATVTELHAAAMQFFALCQALLDESNRDLEAWTTAFELLSIIGQENLYDSKSEAVLLLNQNVELAHSALTESWKAEHLAITARVIQSLTTIGHIDYDLVLPATSRILTRMLYIPEVLPEYFEFLDLLLEYYIKTRTLSEYVNTLFACLLKDASPPVGARQRYQLCLGSSILHSLHLEKLAKAIQQFLTPSQCPTSAEHIFEILKNLREQQKNAEGQKNGDQGKGLRKKRKSEGIAVDRDVDPEVVAVTFSLSARLSQIVLSSLPVQSLPKAERDELKRSVAEFQESFVHGALSKTLKAICKKEIDKSWPTQIMVVALLRLQYALAMSRSLSSGPTYDAKSAKRMLEALDDELLPELCLEIFRTLLHQSLDMDQPEMEQVIGKVLRYLETKFPRTDISWSGQPQHLTFGQPGEAESALALLHMVLERWLPTVDALASAQQLEQLVRVIMSIPLKVGSSLPVGYQLQPEHLLLRTLHSAEFWELHGLRAALHTYLNETTSVLDGHTFTSTSKKPKSSVLTQVISTYTLLLFFPVEYFPKSCRGDLVRRALNADLLISRLGKDKSGDLSVPESLTALRVFLKRASNHSGSVEHQVVGDRTDYLLHLLQEPTSGTVNELFVESTLDLADLYFAELFRNSNKQDTEGLSKVVSSYSQYKLYDATRSIRARSLIRVIELLVQDFSLAGFSEENQATFQDLYSCLVSTLVPKIAALVDRSISEDTLELVPDLISGWYALLCLGKWLGLNDVPRYFGQHLALKFNVSFMKSLKKPTTWVDKAYIMVLAVLLQELYFRDAMEQNDHLDLIVAQYTSSSKVVSSDGRVRADRYISKACRSLSPASFAHVLEVVESAWSMADQLRESLVDLVHLASILLREHPQNTLRIMQGFVTQSINAFNGNDIFTLSTTTISLQVLDFVLQHLLDRPAALRPLDMNGVWSLLSKFLSPSLTHETQTSTAKFHKIVGITGALVRLRRDLVAPTLPHLGLILRQLILMMRSCRPQLAARQTELVMSTQPRWVSSSQPLGVDEAKALSRLLETLTTKTVVRTHATLSEAQKAESLANPFSKHAAYVLKAYIEAMNDPMCILSLDMRRELHPGLYALCSMINEHGRDAIMVSALDAGGKATMKALWKEYEKQRYVGKG